MAIFAKWWRKIWALIKRKKEKPGFIRAIAAEKINVGDAVEFVGYENVRLRVRKIDHFGRISLEGKGEWIKK